MVISRNVIPAKAGIQIEKHWIPDHVRNDSIVKALTEHYTG